MLFTLIIYKIKKIIFFAVLLFSTILTFGQQILWPTDESNEEVKY